MDFLSSLKKAIGQGEAEKKIDELEKKIDEQEDVEGNEEILEEWEEEIEESEEDSEYEEYLEADSDFEEFDEGAFEAQYSIEDSEAETSEFKGFETEKTESETSESEFSIIPENEMEQVEVQETADAPGTKMNQTEEVKESENKESENKEPENEEPENEEPEKKTVIEDEYPILRDSYVSMPEIENNMGVVQIAAMKSEMEAVPVPAVDEVKNSASTVLTGEMENRTPIEGGMLKEELEQIHMDLKRLYRKFEDEVSCIDKKDNAVAAIREELNSFKDNLYINIIRHMLVDFINIREGIRGQVELEKGKGNETMTLEDVSYMIEDFEIILSQNSVEIFKSEPGTKFDPNKHRLVKKIPVSDPNRIHTICESKSDGYIYNNSVIYPEKVTVYTREQEE